MVSAAWWKLSPKSCYTERMAMIVDPILSRFRAALEEVYGERIERVVLFGSRARGDARPDSDYDVVVFLKDFDGFGKEAGRIAEIEADILTETGVVINTMPLQAGSYRDRTGLMRELRRDGLDLRRRKPKTTSTRRMTTWMTPARSWPFTWRKSRRGRHTMRRFTRPKPSSSNVRAKS
jgi:uncharacterized protein